MKVNNFFTQAGIISGKPAVKSAKKGEVSSSAGMPKTDIVDFKKGSSVMSFDKALSNAKVSAMNEVIKPASAQTVASLSAQVKSGQYAASSEQIADAILTM
jgi:anti-sigma28 factor (negative regulator of flagellin synthesis)